MATVEEKIGKKMNEITKNSEHKEGEVATLIEEQTAKLPSDLFQDLIPY